MAAATLDPVAPSQDLATSPIVSSTLSVSAKDKAKKSKKRAINEEEEKLKEMKYVMYFYRPRILEQFYKLELEEGDVED